MKLIGGTVLTRIKPVPILCSALVTMALVVAPYKLAVDSQSLYLNAQLAWAKDGGKGGGNGGGNGVGNAGGNGGGNGNGNAGGKGGDNGNDGKNDNAGNRGDVKGGTINQSTPEIDKSIETDGSEVRHANGMSEKIIDGRYIMKDAKGRTIINRTATSSDQSRLRSFAH
jgi:hypothetical protein